jgi:4'-phosphopantetheinyl transferase
MRVVGPRQSEDKESPWGRHQLVAAVVFSSLTGSTVGPMLSWHSLGEDDLPPRQDWLSAAEAQRASTMRFTKRRTEWLLGRWTGKEALASVLSLPHDPASLARIEIRTIVVGPAQGAPEVFVDGSRVLVGVSLTDRAGWAVCTVADIEEIGCDLELVEPRTDNFVQDYLTANEREAVADPPFEASRDLMANLIWSAKESALKVLRTGLRRDTRSVEVVLSPATSVDGWRALVTHTHEGARFSGWWRQYGAFLLTIVTATERPPPRPLQEPPGLATAEPSHSWMAGPIATDVRKPGQWPS